jgi:hypothetical protein
MGDPSNMDHKSSRGWFDADDFHGPAMAIASAEPARRGSSSAGRGEVVDAGSAGPPDGHRASAASGVGAAAAPASAVPQYALRLGPLCGVVDPAASGWSLGKPPPPRTRPSGEIARAPATSMAIGRQGLASPMPAVAAAMSNAIAGPGEEGVLLSSLGKTCCGGVSRGTGDEADVPRESLALQIGDVPSDVLYVRVAKEIAEPWHELVATRDVQKR